MHKLHVTTEQMVGMKGRVTQPGDMGPFEAGKACIKKAEARAAHYGNGAKPRQEWKAVLDGGTDKGPRTPALPVNLETRMTAYNTLITKTVAGFDVHEMYARDTKDKNIKKLDYTRDDEDELRGLEAVVNLMKGPIALSELEGVLVSIAATMVPRKLLRVTEKGSIMEIDASGDLGVPLHKLQRVKVATAELHSTAREALRRLEHDVRRIVGAPTTGPDLLALALDHRVSGANKSKLYTKEEHRRARERLEATYVDVGLRIDGPDVLQAAASVDGNEPAVPARARMKPTSMFAVDSDDSEDSDDDVDAGVGVKPTPEVTRAERITHWKQQFCVHHQNCLSEPLDVAAVGFVGGHKPADPNMLDPLTDGLRIDMARFHHGMMSRPASSRTFGHLPTLALASLSALPASGFEERINSAAKVVVPDSACNRAIDEIEMETVCRMNRKLLQHMRARHPEVFDGVLEACGRDDHDDN